MADTMDVPDASILQLPAELILRISSFLTTAELGGLRRSCKQIEQQLFDSFAREFFTKRQFMLEQHSLQALVDIANHPTLAKHLTYVIISVERHHTQAAAHHRYIHERVDPMILLCTGGVRDMLTEAFGKLPSLKTIGLRDFAGNGRIRDGEGARWRSYGWADSTLPSVVIEPHEARRYREFRWEAMSSPLFAVLLAALGTAGVTPPGIEVILHRDALTPAACNVFAGSLGKLVAPVLSNLKTLFLVLSVRDVELGQPYSGPPNEKKEDILLPFQRLMHATDNLRHLRLNFTPNAVCDAPRFLTWLGAPASSSNSASPISGSCPCPPAFEKLEILELGMLTNISSQQLLRLLTKPNLKSFSLWKIAISCGTTPQSSCWSQLFAEFARRLPKTSRLETIMIGECSTQENIHPLFFVPAGTATENKPKTSAERKVSYRSHYGSSAAQWLAELAERTYVPGEAKFFQTGIFGGSNADTDSEDSDDDDHDPFEVTDESVDEDDDDSDDE